MELREIQARMVTAAASLEGLADAAVYNLPANTPPALKSLVAVAELVARELYGLADELDGRSTGEIRYDCGKWRAPRKYLIANARTGQTFGSYEALTPAEALDAMTKDTGQAADDLHAVLLESIATNYSLWTEYADPDRLMTQADFNALTLPERYALLTPADSGAVALCLAENKGLGLRTNGA